MPKPGSGNFAKSMARAMGVRSGKLFGATVKKVSNFETKGVLPKGLTQSPKQKK